ncbi:hypothetical protein FOCC_FOCC014768 [Frankliniella occidentalis]|uniref:EIF-2-alpha kinase activator GCN1 n=1 Tax=Frankliniella occidentalis TaxID=133901 RepID=A0A6J1T4U6_FRAOC|nr:eIF-2-alpha kinase activator GCN1 [Frankliniella occidentalis]KAE8739724.1 hypothetical protein FOCC_FOCC014768 [Frankliniella occidentalis]
MADTELAKSLKDLPLRVQSASTKERQQVIKHVISILSKPGITEPIVRGLCRLVSITLPRYTDSSSKAAVCQLVSSLLTLHKEWAVKHLIATLSEVANTYKTLVPTHSTSQIALQAFNWSCMIVELGLKDASDDCKSEFPALFEAQAILLCAAVSSNIKKITYKVQRLTYKMWRSNESVVDLYISTLQNLKDSSQFSVVLGSYLIQHLVDDKKIELVNKFKAALLDLFIKIAVSVKVKPAVYVVDEARPLLRQLTHEEFKGQLLPALQKAMLRSPEVILECVGHVISAVSLDLSQYAADIGKSLAANLHSKEDLARLESADACKRLAQQCSDGSAIEQLLNQIFAVFHGSEGKITVAEQKISVLQGAGNLSYNTVAGSSVQRLATLAAEQFIKVLGVEVHEKTLVYALEMMSLWCTKFTSEVPVSVIDGLKKGLASKNSTALVRSAYIQCLSSCFTSSTAHLGADVVPVLLKTIEKGAAQAIQVPVVTEALAAACLLLKLCISEGTVSETQLSSVLPAIIDAEKQLFVSEKFLTVASDEALNNVMTLSEHLLVNHVERLEGRCQPFHHAIVFCLTCGSPSVKAHSRAVVKKMVSSLGGIEITRALLKELTQYLETVKIQHNDGDSKENKENNDVSSGPGGGPEVSAQSLVGCITTLCSANGLLPEDAYFVAQDSLIPCNHPAVAVVAPDLWLKIVRHLKLDPATLLARLSQNIRTSLVDNYKPTPIMESTLALVVRISPNVILPHLLARVNDILNDQSLLHITKDEYFIYQTPEGVLYDKSCIGKNNDDSLNAKNLKRESKVYSYKDQLEEMALRRELEEKKRREGKLKEPELNPKQKEAMKIQLEKESAVRSRLTLLKNRLDNSLSMLRAALEGNPTHMSRYFRDLLPNILNDLQSPLAAPELAPFYIQLQNGVFSSSQRNLADLIGHVTLRLHKPKCDLNPAWEEEKLDSAVSRAITLMHKTTVRPRNEVIEDAQEKKRILSAPAFCYCFNFIRKALVYQSIQKDEGLMTKGIQIVSAHAQMKGGVVEPKDGIDLYHPDLLPRRLMFELLIGIISVSTGRLQQLASAALMDVAASGSGKEGYARATEDEIDSLLSALQNQDTTVRDAALRGLAAMVGAFPTLKTNPEQAVRLTRRIWVARFDVVDENKELASKLWTAAGLKLDEMLWMGLLLDVVHPVDVVQTAAAKALAALLEEYDSPIPKVIENLLGIYKEKLTMIPAKVDSFGRIEEEAIDVWEPRRGVGLALKELAPLLSHSQVSSLAQFYVSSGLGDHSEEVRKNMLSAALASVDLHGKDTINSLLPVFENFLDKAPDSRKFDAVRQSVVILMGSLARHLDRDDPKVKPIVARLVDALSTPSQQVQEAVANCLPHLVPAVKDDAPTLIKKLMDQLLESSVYGERRGAAYGLAGIIKGMGILALKQYDVMTKLTEAIQDKKNYRHREGALLAFEMLCNMLGRLFEPYIVHVLPHLLLCFGDGNQYVRDATDETARIVMSKLSAHGVKLVLPSLLSALEEDSWRTKTGSVELLGAMAYCAPKQLSSCLPSIVPKLIEVLSDSHTKVQGAGAQALRLIGSVIRNPEIQAIVPVLLEALQDPSHRTATCLQTLLETQFVHFIDAPSLALIMPVVQRAFMDRATETRKMAAQIIGNMYSLTDQKDLMPYLPTIVPGLKSSLLDPVPEVRSVSARALGAMVRGMGEQTFEDLLPWLMTTLTSESSSVDRSGAAQGLSEVVSGLGVEKMHKLMPEIIATAERPDIAPHVKDGYIMMFIYMPGAFHEDFTPYIPQIINPILKALADENEYVRETALKAGQRIVNLYAESAIMLLLPELEKGLFDDNWRIRYSSVQLLGDLLYRISGVSGKMSTETADEDDNFGTEQSHRAIIDVLGATRRNRVLAGLYMGRSDVALMVRQAALHVWKVVVTNTPRTLREILPTLFSLLLGCLASTSYDKRQVAARTLGDLVRKLGERVLPEIIPILERGLESDQADQRQGVCIGLSEIMASTSRDMVLTFVNSLVPTVRKAMCDPLPEVREAAAKTFDSLHSTVGVRALDDILPSMLNQLSDPDPHVVECTLDGLRQVMAIKSRVVLPYLVPQLTAHPVNTKALSILASVAGEALTRYLSKILPALLTALSSAQGTPQEAQEMEYCQAVVLSVSDEVGVRTIVDSLLESSRSEKADLRRSATALLCAFCGQTRANYTQHVPQLLRGIIHLYADSDHGVLVMSCEALAAVFKTLEVTASTAYVGDIKQAIRFAAGDLKGQQHMPGFCLPKGITPMLPMFREAVLNGPPEIKEVAAYCIGDMIKLITNEALAPSVVHITGPLIRILGDRFNWPVKAAVLDTLSLLLSKVGAMLKQFLPQLQTTFVKALNDGNRIVRVKAAVATGHLIKIHTRPDPIYTELHNSIKNLEDPSVRETMLQALRYMITAAGDKMSEAIRRGINQTLIGMLSHHEDASRCAAAGCLGALCRWLSPEQLTIVLSDNLLVDDNSLDWMLRHGRSAALFVALKECPDVVYTDNYCDKLHRVILSYLVADRVQIAQNGIRCCGYLFDHLMSNGKTLPSALISPFVRTMNHSSNEVKQLVSRVCSYLARRHDRKTFAPELLRVTLPMLVNGTKEKNSYVKADSEIALVAVLQLRQGEEMLQYCLSLLDAGAQESLTDVISKVLRKVANQPETKEEELDDTLVT